MLLPFFSCVCILCVQTAIQPSVKIHYILDTFYLHFLKSYLHLICTVQQPTDQIVSVEKGPRRRKQRQEIIQYDSSAADAGEFCVFG